MPILEIIGVGALVFVGLLCLVGVPYYLSRAALDWYLHGDKPAVVVWCESFRRGLGRLLRMNWHPAFAALGFAATLAMACHIVTKIHAPYPDAKPYQYEP